MRNISANGLAQLAKRHGNEPVNIIEVDWIAGRAPASYADKDVQGIPGKIVELGDLDDVVAHVTAESGVTNSDSSQQIDVTLDDVDGSIKTIFDSYDVHKRPVRVYQWFEGLDLSDKFLIFAGKINTPISWNERDRTVKITVVSQLEDQEIGFSAEEGQFPYLPADLVGKAWPMLFGTVIDSPALQINKALEACTLAGVGIVSGSAAMGGLPLYENGTNSDGGGNAGNALTVIQMNIILEASECWMGVDDQKSQQLLDQYNKMAEKLNEELAQKARSGSVRPDEAGTADCQRHLPGHRCEPDSHHRRRGFPAEHAHHDQHQRRPVHRFLCRQQLLRHLQRSPRQRNGRPAGGQRFERPMPAPAREGPGLRLQDGRALWLRRFL